MLRTLFAVGRRRQRRLVYRFEGDAPVNCFSDAGHIGGRLVDASAAGVGLVMDAPLEIGSEPAVSLDLHDAAGEAPRSGGPGRGALLPGGEGRYLIGATITEIDPASRMRLMEWCYVVCSHERLRGHRPARGRPTGAEAIVVPIDPGPGAAATA